MSDIFRWAHKDDLRKIELLALQDVGVGRGDPLLKKEWTITVEQPVPRWRNTPEASKYRAFKRSDELIRAIQRVLNEPNFKATLTFRGVNLVDITTH